MDSLNDTDILIRNYVKDTPNFIECWEFESLDGTSYTIFCDQDGEEWIEFNQQHHLKLFSPSTNTKYCLI